MKSLKIICKTNCQNDFFMDFFDTQQGIIGSSALNVTVLALKIMPKHEILFTYLPKMNLIEYLFSVGGLISM